MSVLRVKEFQSLSGVKNIETGKSPSLYSGSKKGLIIDQNGRISLPYLPVFDVASSV